MRGRRTADCQAVNRADAPASTSITDPVVWRAPAETRYTTAAVTSSGSSQGTGCTWRPAMTGATSSLVACSRSGRISTPSYGHCRFEPRPATGRMNHTEVQSASVAATWHDYLELTKPRVVALIVLTSLVGSLLATPGLPRLDTLLFADAGGH